MEKNPEFRTKNPESRKSNVNDKKEQHAGYLDLHESLQISDTVILFHQEKTHAAPGPERKTSPERRTDPAQVWLLCYVVCVDGAMFDS